MTNDARATAAVIEFITQWNLDRFSREAVSLAKQCIVDGLGVILAGSTAHGTAIVREYVRTGNEVAESAVLGAGAFSCRARHPRPWSTGPPVTHWISTTHNCRHRPIASLACSRHPTIPPLAAGLALGERLGVSGRQLLEAYLIGFEVGMQDGGSD